MDLHIFTPDSDELLYRLAWSWRTSYPRLVQTWDMIKTFDQWFEMMSKRVSVGVVTSRLIALVSLEPTMPGVYEVHVDCERRVDRADLLLALLSIRQTVFEEWNAKEIFAGVISRNRGILSVASICGFTPDGIEEKIGKLRFIRLRITRDEFYQDHEQHGINSEPVHAIAGSVITGHRHAA
jgi:hypothetical protein